LRRLLIALAIALLPSIALAQGHGGGGGMSGGGHMGGGAMSGGGHMGAGHSHFARHHRAFGLWPLYGDYSVPPYESDDDNNVTYASPPETAAPEPTRARSCSSLQTVTVPSEAGGTRQITILRCYQN
jgi:hypothetical protein